MGWDNPAPTIAADQLAQDIAFNAIVISYNKIGRGGRCRAITGLNTPYPFCPTIGLGTGYFFYQVPANQTRCCPGLCYQTIGVYIRARDGPLLGTFFSDMTGPGPRICTLD